MAVQNTLRKRSVYLDRLIALKDTGTVKIITGVRRSGKTSLLHLMMAHLRESGVRDEQIIEMDFESYAFSKMSAEYFFHYVKNRIFRGGHTYLFFDELQHVPDWAEQVSAMRTAFDCDIYITGSNAALLSSAYSTYLSGNYELIRMLPLSFAEFLDFQGYTICKARGGQALTAGDAFADRGDGTNDTADRVPDYRTDFAFNRKCCAIIGADGREHDLHTAFDAYLHYGGMPVLSDTILEEDRVQPYWDGIYSTILLRDILEREKGQGRQSIKDPALLRKIIWYLADHVGRHVSASLIGNTLVGEGLLFEGIRENAPSVHTLQAYVAALTESYLFYDVKRYDIRANESLQTLGKYYIADLGLRSYLLGFENRDSEQALENVVYFELLLRGYNVAVGKIGKGAVDFIATKANEKLYIQVAQSMADEAVKKRELAPLRKIRDNYGKLVLSMAPGDTPEYDGIMSMDLVEWLVM